MADDVRILVAAHKPYWMPKDAMYVPMCVGANANGPIDGFASDDVGDNIADKNPRYCELTALWWGWRNMDCDALGLAHYRRHFAGDGERGVLTHDQATRLLATVPVLVTRHRNYVIESVASHYAHTHDPAHLDALRDAVRLVSPGRMAALEAHLSSTRVHMFNMLVMRREVLDPYCAWLFDVLAAVEERIDFFGMSPFEQRCVGRLGELLLDVWLRSEGVLYAEVGVRELERVNWVKKGSSFLRAKFLGKRYDASF